MVFISASKRLKKGQKRIHEKGGYTILSLFRVLIRDTLLIRKFTKIRQLITKQDRTK